MIRCRRCEAKLLDPTAPCGTCRADRIEAHVRTLVVGAASTHARVLKEALDGWSVARILDHLNDSPLPAEVC